MRRPLPFLLPALLAALLAGCGSGDDSTAAGTPGGGQGSAASAGPAAAHNDADVAFAQQMIPHHQQAVQMATLAETRALAPQVKALAVQIRDAQQPEIDSMTTWLSAWGAPTAGPHAGHAMHGMLTEQQLAELGNSRGAAFDQLFLTGMIAHHRGAVAMAQQEQQAGQYQPAKELAGMIVSTQQAEISEMEALLQQL